MAYELIVLGIGGLTNKEAFLRHIYDLHQIKVEAGETYSKMFDKLRERFKDNPEKLAAVEEWIAFNIEDQKDSSIFDVMPVTNSANQYVIFDLVPIK